MYGRDESGNRLYAEQTAASRASGAEEGRSTGRQSDNMNTTMEELRELDDYVEMQVEAAYQACVEKEQDENCLIRKEPLLQYPELLQNKVIFRCLAETAATQKNLGRVHVEDVRAVVGKAARTQSGSSGARARSARVRGRTPEKNPVRRAYA